MALTTTGIDNNIEGAFSAASGFSATELSGMIVALIFIALFIWAAWGTIGSFLNLASGNTTIAGFGVALGLIFAVLIFVMVLISP